MRRVWICMDNMPVMLPLPVAAIEPAAARMRQCYHGRDPAQVEGGVSWA